MLDVVGFASFVFGDRVGNMGCNETHPLQKEIQMDHEAHMALLTIIHEMQVASADCRKALTILAENATSSEVTLPLEGALATSLVLEVQSQLLTHLLEENSMIRDSLEKLTEKLSSRK